MMRFSKILLLLILFFQISACNKEGDDSPYVPPGQRAFSDEELAFVPYTAGEKVFKKLPDLTEEFSFIFQSRTADLDVNNWDESKLLHSEDSGLELSLKFRYLQASQEVYKTLAVYMPYRKVTSAISHTLFEFPISPIGISTSYFKDLVTFYTSIEINGVIFSNVFEVEPFLTADDSDLAAERFTKIRYNQEFGLIELIQEDGSDWILQP